MSVIHGIASRSRFAIALALAVAGILGACGGDGGGPTAPSPPAAPIPSDDALQAAGEDGSGAGGDSAISDQRPDPADSGLALTAPDDPATKAGQPKLDLCHWDSEAMAFVQIRVGRPGFDNHLRVHPLDKPLPTWWRDADGDGFGDAGVFVEACDQPGGFVDNADDCDDGASSCTTLCGGDEDGDGRVDCLDRCSDADTDGYGGDRSATVVGGGAIAVGACTVDGSTPCDVGPACLAADCDDAATSCTTDCADGDGDGTAECLDRCIDFDGDGYGADNSANVVGAGSVAVGDCTTDGASACALTAPCAGEDCDDTDPGVNPGADDGNCDGVDDDCDGSADDGYVETPTSCGVGVCEAGGQLICQNGSEVDTCSENPPTETPEASCNDGLDNDCDGFVDDADGDDCGNQPPVATDDDFVGMVSPACVLPTCGGDRQCVLAAPAGTITANDSDPDGDPITSASAMQNIPGRSCNADFLCTTDSGFDGPASGLSVNANGGFDLTYRTTQNFVIGGPADVVIAEFLYVVTDDEGAVSNVAQVMVPVYTDQSCP